MGPWPSARHRENYLGPSTQQGLAMALQTGCTEIYQPLLLMLLHPKSRCISAACAGGPPCAQVPWLLSWVPFSSGEVRAVPETEARKVEMEAVGTPAAEASVTFAKDFWEDLLGMGALDGGQ